SFALASGETVHLRPKGAYHGRLRACRRWGRGAWAYGAHPIWVLLSGVRRLADPPYALAGLSYMFGWAVAAARRSPRAEPEVRAYARREHLLELRRWIARRETPPG